MKTKRFYKLTSIILAIMLVMSCICPTLSVSATTEAEIESIRTVGNGDGYWLNGVLWDPAADENYMTEISPNVYEINYIEIEQFDYYQVKFAANGTWADNWGGVYVGSGIETEAEYDSSNNITFDVPYELANVTIKLDLTSFDYTTKTGATFTITVTDANATESTTTVEPTEAPETNGLTVNASSNLFPTATATFNEDYSQVTVTYLINSEKDMLNCNWELHYDTEKLAFNKNANLNSTGNRYNFMPQVSSDGVFYVSETGIIKGNATNLYLYLLSDNSNPVTFVTATFDIIGTGETTVNLDVKKLIVSVPDDNSMSDIAQEETIVDSSCVQDYNCKIDLSTTIDGKKDTIETEPTEAPTTEPSYVNIIGDISLSLTDNGSGVYSGRTELDNGSYSFKINESGTEMGFGYTFTDSISGMIYSADYKASTTINATGGYYTFTYNLNTNKLVVAYEPYPTEEPTIEPEPEITYIVAGSEELCYVSWDGTAIENSMAPNGDGTYSITFYDIFAYENPLQLKVVENSPNGMQSWIGDELGNNITFRIVSECDVTVTYNPDTKEITVTGDGVQMVTDIEIDSMRTVGNGDGTWLNNVSWDPADDANLMTEIAYRVYSITYEDVEEFNNYQVKFATNGCWNDNWSGIYEGSGIVSEAEYNSQNNITFDVPYELANVTITLDLTNFNYSNKTGAKFTITVEDANPQPTTEPTTVQPTTTPAEDTKIYFEVPTLEEWGTTKYVFCHVYNVYGGTPLKTTSWQSKSEKCTLDSNTGLYYFDTSKLGTIEDGADYALLFSTKDTNSNYHQTCNVTFGKECLGETVYVTGAMVENTEDSSKLDYEATWRNPELAQKYGAKAAITSTCNMVGKFFPIYQPKEQIVSQAIASWAVINAEFYTPEAVQQLCIDMGVAPINVYQQYEADYADLLADPENNPNLASLENVYSLLGLGNTATYIVAGTEKLCGVNWDSTAIENAMTPNGDGTYSKVFTDVAVMDDYQLKVVENLPDGTQNWIGDLTGCYICFDVISECDVTVTYNPSTQEIAVTGDGVQIITDIEIDSMRTVGDGDGNWLNGVSWDPADDANLMTEIAYRVYSITYEDIEAYDNYQLKFATNGCWNDNWGGVYEGSGIVSEAEYNSQNNITIDVPYELANVTITLDLTNFDYVTKTGAKFTVIVEDATQQPTTEPATEPVPEKDELTVNATSNFFPTAQATFNKDYSQVTVTYLINSSKDMLNTQWTLTYDPEVLQFNKNANLNSTGRGYNFMPQVSANGVFNVRVGKIMGNATDLGLYALSCNSEPVTFVTATFDIIGTGDTTVELYVDVLNVSTLGADFMTDATQEETVIFNGLIFDYGCAIDLFTNIDGKIDTTETEPVTTEPVPTTDELTVNATSNFFTSQTATYNNRTNKLVVTYYIQSVKDLLNTQWQMTYDPNVLSVSTDVNTKTSICPSFTTSNTLSINEGIIKFNTYNLSLFDISSEEKVFARVVFDVNDFEALGIYDTTIDLNVINLTVSALDSSTSMTDENEEVRVVYNSKYDDAYGLITSERIEMINYEIPRYIGDVDNSDIIDIHDATKLAKYLAELTTLTDEQLLVADCDGDGIISIKDVTFIQLYLVDAVNYGNVGQEYKFKV